MEPPKQDDANEEEEKEKYSWANPHPFYRRLITFFCLFSAIAAFTYTNASQFDETELKLLAMIAPILIGREIWGAWRAKGKNQ